MRGLPLVRPLPIPQLARRDEVHGLELLSTGDQPTGIECWPKNSSRFSVGSLGHGKAERAALRCLLSSIPCRSPLTDPPLSRQPSRPRDVRSSFLATRLIFRAWFPWLLVGEKTPPCPPQGKGRTNRCIFSPG